MPDGSSTITIDLAELYGGEQPFPDALKKALPGVRV